MLSGAIGAVSNCIEALRDDQAVLDSMTSRRSFSAATSHSRNIAGESVEFSD